MSKLCTTCIKNETLRRVIESEGTSTPTCPVCGAENVAAIECTNPEFKSKFRALIRYHFSEWHYNRHWGGDSIEVLLSSENPITNYGTDWNTDAYDDALMEILEPAYEEYDEGISLYAGYTDGVQNRLLVAIKNDFDSRLRELRDQSLVRNHFLLDDEVRTLLTPRVNDVDTQFPKGSVLTRSRVGFADRAIPLMALDDERHYRPYSEASISAPPPPHASAGRMNRGGVSFLYLATDTETAIAEIRPHPGHFCSIGSFEARRDLRVADLTSIDVCNYATSDRQLDEYLLLKTIDDLFSIPVIPEKRTDYHLTQLLADAFRHLGFDAVCYKSSVGDGKNYVVFDPQLFNYVNGSGAVYKIKELRYRQDKMIPMADDDDYMTRPDGSFL